MKLDFKIIGEEIPLRGTPIFTITEQRKQLPNGEENNYVRIKSPDWVSAIVYNEKTEKYVMVKQFRHGINKVVTEFPCGQVEEVESSLDAIIRECSEEIGLTKDNILSIKKIFRNNPNPAFMSNLMTGYYIIASDLSTPTPDKDEFIEVVELTEEEIEKVFREQEENTGALQLLLFSKWRNNERKF